MIDLTVTWEKRGSETAPFSLLHFVHDLLGGKPYPLQWVVTGELTPSKVLAATLFLNRWGFLAKDLMALVQTFVSGEVNENFLAHAPDRYAKLYLDLKVFHKDLDKAILYTSEFLRGEEMYSPPEGVVNVGTNGFVVIDSHTSLSRSHTLPWGVYRGGGLRGLAFCESDNTYIVFSKSKEVWDLDPVLTVLSVISEVSGFPPPTLEAQGIFGVSPVPKEELLKALVRL